MSFFMFGQPALYSEKIMSTVEEIFEFNGFEVTKNNKSDKSFYDFSIHKNEKEFFVNVKISRDINFYSNIFSYLSEEYYGKDKNFILLIVGKIPNTYKENVPKNVIIFDLPNLIYAVEKNKNLKSQFVSLLDFSVRDVIGVEPDKRIWGETKKKSSKKTSKKQQNEREKNEMLKWIALVEKNSTVNKSTTAKGWFHKNSKKYEKLRTSTLKWLLVDDLSLWQEQQRSNEDLFAFDLVCKIKDNTNKQFWNMVENFFNTKYVLFEFKNYQNKISQKEIFTTEKYLYKKGLRNLAIIISNVGENENASKAIKGCLRENGKLIISLTNGDLLQMIEMKMKNDDCTEHLSRKLDEMLIDLEK